ncbi:MAG: FHA domain-containing protein [Anaerolineae bacterium]|jgi:pSer/pThr/pTyr-binding forkhead associated (FHA) protein
MDILLLVLRLLLAGLLYAFLGAVLLLLWRDLTQATTQRETAQPRSHLVVVETAGEQASEPAMGTVFPLRAVTSIGRSPTNTVVIPDTYASSQHALLAEREGQWWLEDRNSRNGTMLNGGRIEEPTVVSTGDVIGVGRTQLRLETS